MSVRQAQMEISAAEFNEWMAFYELEPFGDMICDLRHGVAAALLANVNRNADKYPEPFKPSDFIEWRQMGEPAELEPILLDDAEAQSNLIRAQMFGLPPKE